MKIGGVEGPTATFGSAPAAAEGESVGRGELGPTAAPRSHRVVSSPALVFVSDVVRIGGVKTLSMVDGGPEFTAGCKCNYSAMKLRHQLEAYFV